MKKSSIIRTVASAYIGMSLTYSLVFASTIGTINIETAPIFDSLEVESNIVDIATQDTSFEIIEKINDFYEINYNGEVAYINESFVDVTKTTGTALSEETQVFVEPAEETEVIGNVPKDTEVLIVEDHEEYYEIEVNNDTGFVDKDEVFVEFVEDEEDKQQKIQELERRQELSDTLLAIVSESNVNVRSEANINSDVLGKVNKGQQLDAIAIVDDSWIEVDYNGQTGYIADELVNLVDEADLPDTSDLRNQIAQYGLKFIGTPYRYGGTDLNTGVDCSGFVSSVFANFDIYLSRTSRDQYNDGYHISKDELKPADLVFFQYNGSGVISHAGIYIGNGDFVHAASGSQNRVMVSNLNEDYYLNNYYGATRVIND